MNIFTRHAFVPAQFPDVEWDLDKIHEGLRQLGYTRGSPGYKAIENPMTPVDKAFQIYALNLIVSSNFSYESTDHETMWARRDAAWKSAALWLMETQPLFECKTKKEQKDLLKVLPEALRAQCSLELPPGPWEKFPKDSMKKPQDIDKCMDRLQKIGLNWKIHGIAILEGETPDPAKTPRPYGGLEEIKQIVQTLELAPGAYNGPNP